MHLSALAWRQIGFLTPVISASRKAFENLSTPGKVNAALLVASGTARCRKS